jgi:threonine synthase
MLGASVLEVRGDFDAALGAAQELARRGTHVLVNSLNPYRRAGQKTAVLEIVEELGGAPDAFVLPYGGGGNTSAYAQALAELGLDTPIVSVEAENRRETLATAIRIGDPVHAAAVRAAHARVLHVDDDEIVSTWRLLAAQEGLFCEPSSAAGLAAVLRGDVEGDRLAVTITGHGLKDPAIADRLAATPVEVDPDPDAIAAASAARPAS